MARTAIIYEGNYPEALTAVKNLMRILGAGRYFASTDFNTDSKDDYDLYCLIGPVVGDKLSEGITEFASANTEWLSSKHVILCAMGNSKVSGDSHFGHLKEKLGNAVQVAENIVAAAGELDLAAIAETGLRFRAIKEGMEPPLAPEKLLAEIEKFLGRHKYCILCTTNGEQVRGTAVTYKYHDGYVYIVCEGSNKFANLNLNNNVCIALQAPHEGGRMPAGIQLTGKAEILEPESDAYKQMMVIKGSDYERLTSLPFILWGIAVKLEKAEFWWSHWSEMGLSPKQTYNFA
jgi:nitroimidazol reductase NimA-like FMN-containing flavoprotein (pyridoxamine 5'-phosphate oxidase superfamily)